MGWEQCQPASPCRAKTWHVEVDNRRTGRTITCVNIFMYYGRFLLEMLMERKFFFWFKAPCNPVQFSSGLLAAPVKIQVQSLDARPPERQLICLLVLKKGAQLVAAGH
jgi:hypothetical protein